MARAIHYSHQQGVLKAKMSKAKRALIASIAATLSAGALAIPAFAAPPPSPGSYGTASPNAQCGTAAGSGGYADEYGNFGSLGAQGGANGYRTGLNNSAECGNRQGNL